MNNDETKVLPEGQDKAPTTQPMLEAILAKVDDGFAAMNLRFDGLENRMERMENRMEKMENRFDRLEKEFRGIKRDQRTVNDRLLDLQGLHRELEERVDEAGRQ